MDIIIIHPLMNIRLFFITVIAHVDMNTGSRILLRRYMINKREATIIDAIAGTKESDTILFHIDSIYP